MAAPDRIDRDGSVQQRPPFEGHAVAVAGDVKPDQAGAKSLKQILGIAYIIAEIGHDQGIVVVAAIDCQKCTGPLAAVKTEREFAELADTEPARRNGAVATDNGRRTVAAAADIMSDHEWIEAGPGSGVVVDVLPTHRIIPAYLSCWNGLGAGTPLRSGGGRKAFPSGAKGA